MAFYHCLECGHPVSINAPICLNCGNPYIREGPVSSSEWFGFVLALPFLLMGVLFLFAICGGGFSKKKPEIDVSMPIQKKSVEKPKPSKTD